MILRNYCKHPKQHKCKDFIVLYFAATNITYQAFDCKDRKLAEKILKENNNYQQDKDYHLILKEINAPQCYYDV